MRGRMQRTPSSEAPKHVDMKPLSGPTCCQLGVPAAVAAKKASVSVSSRIPDILPTAIYRSSTVDESGRPRTRAAESPK